MGKERGEGPIYLYLYKHPLQKRACCVLNVVIFLLVVRHSSAGEEHCGEDGEREAVNGVAGQSEACPLCYLSQEVGSRHVFKHSACGWKTEELRQVCSSIGRFDQANATLCFTVSSLK